MTPIKLLNYNDNGVPIHAQMVNDRVMYSEIRYFIVYIATHKPGARTYHGYQVYTEEAARASLREGSRTINSEIAWRTWDYFERKMEWR